jgi:hypothetical protein
MPNWCANNIELRHKDPAMIQRAVEAFKQGKFCDEFIPVPKQLIDTVSGSLGDGYEQELNQFKMQLNEKYFGYSTWYEFCINKWGTKWDVGDAESVNTVDDTHMVAFFDSAWAPPIGLYEALLALDFDVEACYYEPGMAFVGKWYNGDDFCINYGEYNSDTVREAIGEELDDMFCISEDMSQWEEENE